MPRSGRDLVKGITCSLSMDQAQTFQSICGYGTIFRTAVSCSQIDGTLQACARKLFMTWKFGIISCHSSVEQMNCSVHHAADSPFLTLSSDLTLVCIYFKDFSPVLWTLFPPTENAFKSPCAAFSQHLALVFLSIPSPTLPDLHFLRSQTGLGWI